MKAQFFLVKMIIPLLIAFLSSAFDASAMHDSIPGPLTRIVEEKAQDPNSEVYTDQANSMSFRQSRYSHNEHQYDLDVHRSDHPHLIDFFPSAPDGGMIMSAFQEAQPGWLGKGQLEEFPPGKLGKNHGESRSGSATGASKRKTTDPPINLDISGSLSAASSKCLDPKPPKGFQLMGVFIKPEGNPRKPEVDGRMQDPKELNFDTSSSSPSRVYPIGPDGSRMMDSFVAPKEKTRKLNVDGTMKGPDRMRTSLLPERPGHKDSNSQSMSLVRHSTETGPSRLSGISLPLSEGPSNGDANTASVSRAPIDHTSQMVKKDQADTNSEFQKLTNVFKALESGELVMTEDQFIWYHGSALHAYEPAIPKKIELSYHSHTARKSYLRNQNACQYLKSEQVRWYEWWEQQTKYGLESFIVRIRDASRKSEPSLRWTIAIYLYLIQTISMVVPRNQGENDVAGELVNALRLVENIFQTQEQHNLIHHTIIDLKRNEFKELFQGPVFSMSSRAWALVDIWMETFRNALYTRIISNSNPNALRNSKSFFSFLFFLSVRPFTDALEAPLTSVVSLTK
ncbi:hypothetical protein MJO28_009304 [Puccinia striiformis f. sp. tritici]|uniref:Uncharacterized protein n=1 Tax=Puccinia striiformis f. sp. tritici TaxID=168172 RepID=A0ACC0E8Y2_9BASI|nr:hypothetical protein MJO28_009304 [Puccinia striiformis f. sp. tritici]